MSLERLMMTDLIKWKKSIDKKPLIVQGVRQCGKTYLIKEFGERYYDDIAYYKFDENERLTDFFSPNLDPHRIIKEMSISRNKDIAPEKTLLVFDEIQTCGKALTSLKYFNEEAPEYHIIAAGSLLGVALPKGTSFPVGKVDFLNLYPMSFFEYIQAANDRLAAHLNESSFTDTAWKTFSKQLTELYRDYLIIGGMPEVVQSWIDKKSIDKTNEIQKKILLSYQNDFTKYTPVQYFPKISAIWNSIPSQLTKENRKFIFSQVKKGWRAKDLEDALEWLVRAGLVYKAENIEKPNFPISAYANHTFFKLYMADVGLLRQHSDLPPSVLFDSSVNYKEFKGAIAENFVCTELKSIYNKQLYYWTAEGSAKAEVDFIIQDDKYIIPIEVKAHTAKHARSLKQYCNLFKPEKSILTSLDDISDKHLPLYALWNLRKWLKTITNST